MYNLTIDFYHGSDLSGIRVRYEEIPSFRKNIRSLFTLSKPEYEIRSWKFQARCSAIDFVRGVSTVGGIRKIKAVLVENSPPDRGDILFSVTGVVSSIDNLRDVRDLLQKKVFKGKMRVYSGALYGLELTFSDYPLHEVFGYISLKNFDFWEEKEEKPKAVVEFLGKKINELIDENSKVNKILNHVIGFKYSAGDVVTIFEQKAIIKDRFIGLDDDGSVVKMYTYYDTFAGYVEVTESEIDSGI